MHHGWSSHFKEVTALFLCHIGVQKDLKTSKDSEVWLVIIIRIQTNAASSISSN